MRRLFSLLSGLLLVIALVGESAALPLTHPYKPLVARPPIESQVVSFTSSLKGTVWYQADCGEPNVKADQSKLSSVIPCKPKPLILFSHGFGGCSTQSLFLVESLASVGYIVAAPNHSDAKCNSIDYSDFSPPIPSFRDAEMWNAETFENRRKDIVTVMNYMLSETSHFSVDSNKIGFVGHSLGGYTGLGMIGGWDTWKDPRIKAALLLSPYAAPFLINGRIPFLSTPVMFQGGTLDFGITPKISRAGGAYDSAPAPKYFLSLRGAGHFAWTNLACKGLPTLKCLIRYPNAAAITRYGIAFLDTHVIGARRPLLTSPKPLLLAEYRFSTK